MEPATQEMFVVLVSAAECIAFRKCMLAFRRQPVSAMSSSFGWSVYHLREANHKEQSS